MAIYITGLWPGEQDRIVWTARKLTWNVANKVKLFQWGVYYQIEWQLCIQCPWNTSKVIENNTWLCILLYELPPPQMCTCTSICLLCVVIQHAYYHYHYAACRATASSHTHVPTCPEGPREKEPDLTLHTYSWPVEEQALFQVLVLYYTVWLYSYGVSAIQCHSCIYMARDLIQLK